MKNISKILLAISLIINVGLVIFLFDYAPRKAKEEDLATMDLGKIVDEESRVREYDFMIANKVLGEVLPRVCVYQKKKLNIETGICVLYELEEMKVDATEVLKNYRDSL